MMFTRKPSKSVSWRITAQSLDLRMKKHFALPFASTLCLAVLAALGCHHEEGPPPPLAADQIPSAFSAGFKDAKADVKDLADKVVKALEAKDYPAAYQAVQDLAMAPGATKANQTLAARAHLTILGLLQTAQAAGDEKANEAIKLYNSTK